MRANVQFDNSIQNTHMRLENDLVMIHILLELSISCLHDGGEHGHHRVHEVLGRLKLVKDARNFLQVLRQVPNNQKREQ